MNMQQQGVHSRSSANGFGRRKGEKEVGTRPDNKSQSGKSNAGGRLTNTGSRIGGHGSPSRDRLVYVSTCLVGLHVDVQVKSGSKYSGIFHAISAEKDFAIVLKMARVTKDVSSRGQKSNAESISKAPLKTLIIPAKELVQVIAKDVSVTRDGFSDEVQSEKQQDIMIDSHISQSRNVEVERQLERWVPDDDDPQRPELENVFDNPRNRGWNQFEANEALFGVKSTFKEELYTTKLETGPQMREREREALRIAREIEGEDTRDLHLAEERGRHLSEKFDIDEETRFSSVNRGKIVDDSGYEESEDVLLDSCNDETFGDSSTSAIKSSTDWTKGKSNDVVRVSSSSCASDQAQSSQSNVGLDISRSGSFDHTRQPASESPFINSTTDSESRSQENQLSEHVGTSDTNECSEKQDLIEETQLPKSDDSSLSLTGTKDGSDKEISLHVNSHAPSRVSSKGNEKLNSSIDLVEGPVTGKGHGETQAATSHGRPGSSASTRSDRAVAAAASSAPGLSPSSSVGSLSSEKSTLNQHAKEFKLNPNAKSFVPSPIRPPSPAADSTYYYPPNVPTVAQIPGLPMGIAPHFGPQHVMFNPQAGSLQAAPQAYLTPNGPQYAPQMLVHPRQVLYMPGYHQPEMPYRGREY